MELAAPTSDIRQRLLLSLMLEAQEETRWQGFPTTASSSWTSTRRSGHFTLILAKCSGSFPYWHNCIAIFFKSSIYHPYGSCVQLWSEPEAWRRAPPACSNPRWTTPARSPRAVASRRTPPPPKEQWLYLLSVENGNWRVFKNLLAFFAAIW